MKGEAGMILVTGANGFVGRNLVEFLKTKPELELYLFDKENTMEELDGFCSDCDFASGTKVKPYESMSVNSVFKLVL